MIEIFAKFAFGDQRLEIARRRRYDAHIDRNFGASAYTLECLVDQHAQNLILRLARQISDIVDEQRASMRLFERTWLAPFRAVGLVDTEKFDFHAFRRDRCGVDDDKGPVYPTG